MQGWLLGLSIFSLSINAFSETLPFDLYIKGEGFDVQKNLELSDVGEGKTKIQFDLENKAGKKFQFDLNYKKLPSNRSYPTNLDINFKDADGKKLGYLFFANNGVQFLKKMGLFGLVVNVDGQLVDIQFVFDKNKKGQLKVADLGKERFVQDTLVPKFNFQMIRPVILPEIKTGLRSQTYHLDKHPYAVNYSLKDMDNGGVQFQHNLYQITDGKQDLLERIYFNADSLDTLREAMYAGKYFHQDAGAFKLVFYPAMGQTEPPK